MKKSLLLVAVVSIIGYSAVRWRGSATTSSSPSAETQADTRLVQDRLWIDHVPRNDKEKFNMFAMLTQEPIGVFQTLSQWQGSYELFRYEARGGEVRVVFPQTGDREKLTVIAKKCNERGMDFCLEIAGASRGVKHYYSREGWDIGSVDAAKALLKSVTP